MKYRKFLAASDNHGDMVDEAVGESLFAFKKEFRPEILIHGGDNWDFRNLRRGATDDERAHSLIDDWDAGKDFMERFFDGGRENHFLRGNHDERLWHFAESASGLLRDYATDGIKRVEGMVRKFKAKMLPYDARHGVLEIGKLKIVHGYAHGIGAPAKMARAYGSCLYGHVHSMAVVPVENNTGPSLAMGMGCICQIDMPYNQHQMNKLIHQNGWVYGMIFEDGTYQAFQAKRINGRFACATEIKSF